MLSGQTRVRFKATSCRRKLNFYTQLYDNSNAFGHNPADIATLARGAVYGIIIGMAEQANIDTLL